MRKWWDKVEHYGPLFGYYPKASKSWLIVKDEHKLVADNVFSDTKINITTDGKKYLGSFIGTQDEKEKYIIGLVNEWIVQIKKLAKIALFEPHAAYAAYISGFQHKFNYFIRTLNKYIKVLDDVIDNTLIPALTEGHKCTENERILLSLPIRYGGMGIVILVESSKREHENSVEMTKQLAERIKLQQTSYKFDKQLHNNIKSKVLKQKLMLHNEKLKEVRQHMTNEQLRANDLATMKGASSWLSALPLKSENYALNKREFYDAIRMRYRWKLKFLPTICVCGKRFTIDHAMSCVKGGYIHQRHDELRDTLAKISEEISNDVETEPHLQPLTGEKLSNSANSTDEATLDISVRGFWQRGQRAFFDVRVFNPFALTHLNQKLPNAFKSNENIKKRAYGQRVLEVEHGSLTPLIFTPYGGSSRETEHFISTLSHKVAEKRNLEQSTVTNWLRTKLSFCLLRSAILCIRGSRNTKRRLIKVDVDCLEISNAMSQLVN